MRREKKKEAEEEGRRILKGVRCARARFSSQLLLLGRKREERREKGEKRKVGTKIGEAISIKPLTAFFLGQGKREKRKKREGEEYVLDAIEALGPVSTAFS